MTRSIRALLVGAALSGFAAGLSAAAVQTGGDQNSAQTGKKATKAKREKHTCKGQNTCKGKGGCGSTKSKNDCRGKGGCRTDGKKDGCPHTNTTK